MLEEVHAYGVEHRGDDAEHLVRELRVSAQHVVELASANPRRRTQKYERRDVAYEDAHDAQGYVDRT